MNDLYKLIRETREHKLLFGSEIGEYTDQIYNKGVDLELIEATRDNPKPEDFAKRTELVEWFVQQSRLAPSLFLKYLDFRQSRAVTETRLPVRVAARLSMCADTRARMAPTSLHTIGAHQAPQPLLHPQQYAVPEGLSC